MRRLEFAVVLLLVYGAAGASDHDSQRGHIPMMNRLIDEGFNHSQVAELASHLTDRIGSRLTNSPQARRAEAWSQQRLRAWGLSNVRAEGVEFGRGWSYSESQVRLLEPRHADYISIPVAWTPGTKGLQRAQAILAPMERDEDLEAWRGRLHGKVVLVSNPNPPEHRRYPRFERRSDDDLAELDHYRLPEHRHPESIRHQLHERGFDQRRDAFLAQEGAIAWIRTGYAEGNLVWGGGYQHRVGQTPTLPGFEVARDHYRQIARMAIAGETPVVEFLSETLFHDDDTKAYNILADVPGKRGSSEYVMAGAHLDSWAAADGAQDNAAGVAIVMEAARLLAVLDVKPRRTIRFALWGAEEQGMFGSLDYLQRYLARRAPVTEEAFERLPPFRIWDERWPITTLKGYEDLSVYFNLDNGSGKIRGIYTGGNLAAVPLFERWLSPFASMGANHVAAAPTRGTDHVPMRQVGIPAFQFVQDSLDWVAHTNLDHYDHLELADMRQAAVILAAVLLQAANHDSVVPRMPMPTRPTPTDPFEYPRQPRRH